MKEPIISTGLCKRCAGSGQLLRPTPAKLLHFKKCTNCQGHGFRFTHDEKLSD